MMKPATRVRGEPRPGIIMVVENLSMGILPSQLQFQVITHQPATWHKYNRCGIIVMIYFRPRSDALHLQSILIHLIACGCLD